MSATTTDFVGSVSTFLSDYKLQTGKVTLWDYNFQLPTNKLDLEQPSRFSFGDNQKLEIYDFPGGYARKYDGIDKGGGEQAGELNKVFNDRQSTVKKMMESLDAQVTTATANSDCCSMTAGYRFTLSHHPNANANKHVHDFDDHARSRTKSELRFKRRRDRSLYKQFYVYRARCGSAPFRPPRKTPKPIVHGSQTAFVVGPAAKKFLPINTGASKFSSTGTAKDKVNEASSCWVRVAQTWAGNKWGTMFIPRIGMEVIVHFLEGDPDQPIITGCVYNPQTMPPYTLPDEKTKSTHQIEFVERRRRF